MQMGNVARVDAYYGNDSTASIGGLPFASVNAAITYIVGTGSLTSPQYPNTTIWMLPGTYNVGPTGTNSTITDAKGATSYPLISLPTNSALRGLSLQTCIIQCSNPTQNTTLLQMGNNTRVEDLNLTLGGSSYVGSNKLVGIYYGSNTAVTAKLRTSTVNVCNSSMPYTSSNNIYGIQFDGGGTLGTNTFSFNCVKGSTVNVFGNGSGLKRGMIVTNSNIVTLRDTNVYVAAPPTNSNFAGSYVGIETNDTSTGNNGAIQLRTTTIGTVQPTGVQTYTASDILQTTPANPTNPTYLASAGIQLGPGVDLVTKTAGGQGFSTYVYPTQLFYAVIGVLNVSGVTTTGGYLWPGSVPVNSGSGQAVVYPDQSTPSASYRVQQPIILSGMTVTGTTAPGSTHTTTVTVRRTPSGGSIASTSFTLSLTGSSTFASMYNASVNFAAGDLIHVLVTYDAGANATADLSVQLDCF